jgi:hypothetical protein
MTRSVISRKDRNKNKITEKAAERQNKEMEIIEAAEEKIETKQKTEEQPKPTSLKKAAEKGRISKSQRNKSYYLKNKERIIQNIKDRRLEKQLKHAEEKLKKLSAAKQKEQQADATADQNTEKKADEADAK